MLETTRLPVPPTVDKQSMFKRFITSNSASYLSAISALTRQRNTYSAIANEADCKWTSNYLLDNVHAPYAAWTTKHNKHPAKMDRHEQTLPHHHPHANAWYLYQLTASLVAILSLHMGFSLRLHSIPCNGLLYTVTVVKFALLLAKATLL